MDLLHKLGLQILLYEDNIKNVTEMKEESSKFMKEGILKNNESVILLEIKTFSELNQENFYKIHQFMTNTTSNFIKLKYLLVKSDNEMFFGYEKVGQTLMDYFHKNELNVEARLCLYKQATEIISQLIEFNDNFSFFEHNFFFIQECEFNKRPILKILYHGKKNNLF